VVRLAPPTAWPGPFAASRGAKEIYGWLGSVSRGAGPADQLLALFNTRSNVIILGIILLVVGFVAKIAILWTIGIIILVIGAILLLLGATGRAVGGRKHWY